jgi:hypothetical protein
MFRLPMVGVLVVAQLCLAFAPVGEARFGPDARPHVEAGGTATHHAHDDSHCAACTARGILSTSELSSRAGVTPQREGVIASTFRDSDFSALHESTSRPRAPPVGLA